MANSQSHDPSVIGQWASLQQLPYAPVHAALLPTGKVLFWPSFALGNNPQLWDPTTGAVVAATPASFNIFCAGHSFLANGQLLVTGGDSTTDVGVPNATIYDPVSGSWTDQPMMNEGRWYPTNTTLANSDVVVVSGEISPTLGNDPLPQVWQAATGTWRNLTSAQLLMPTYPSMFLLATGLIFNAGPNQQTRFLNSTGTGGWTIGPMGNFGTRDYGPAVMYDDGKVLLIGGGDPPTATAEIIDLNAAVPTWRYTNPMNYVRRQANATLLPDGKVLVTGGSSGPGFDNSSYPVYPAEMWDPATENWTVLDSLSIYRGYHSTAVLLPDGRVFSGGGSYSSGEVYSPPYLFKGTRPSITSAPPTVAGGSTFFVATPDAPNITAVNWIRLSATTHTFNQNQRINHLSFTQLPGGLNVTAPANSNMAPGGDYLLFLINGNGTPSIGSYIRVDNSAFQTGATSLAMSTTALNFSKQLIGTSGKSASLILTNLGNSPVSINGTSFSGHDFVLTSTTCGSSLPATSSCQFNLALKPTVAGSLHETVSITDSDISSPQVVALNGTGYALQASPTSFNLGTVPLGTTGTNRATLTLTNLGPTAISINSLTYSNSQFSEYLPTTTCGSTLAGNSSCIIYSVFTPSATGPQTGTLSIADSDPSSPTSVTFNGVGTAVQLVPSHYSWGTKPINLATSPVSITLTNVGPVVLNISNATITGTNSTNFAIASNNCGSQVAAGTSCVIQVTFTPTTLGATYSAALTITDDGGGSPQQLSLGGTGGNGIVSIALTPADPTVPGGKTLQLTATATNADSSTRSVTSSAAWSSSNTTIATVGAATGLVTGISSGGATISATVGTITGSTTVTVPAGSTTTSLSSSNNPSTVGQSVTFTASVSPNTATGSVQFFDGSTSLGTSTLNSGSASLITSSLTAGTHSITASYSGDANDSGGTSPVLTQTVSGSTATTTSISSSLNPSYAAQSVTFTTAVSPAAVTGSVRFFDGSTLLSDVALVNASASFATSTLAVGSHSITATYSGDANYGSSTSPVLTQSIIKSYVALSPNTLTFKKQLVNTTSTAQAVTLSNSGSSAVAINGTSFSAADFVLTSTTCGSSLPAASSCQFNLALKPTVAGSLHETFSITDSDISSPQVVALNGTGYALQASPTSFNLGTVPLGTTGTNRATLTLTNLGPTAISINSLTYSNSQFSEYLPTTTCGSSLAGNSSCIIYSVFTPTATGTQTGTLSIADSDPSSPTSVAFNGVGTAVQLVPTHYAWGTRPINATTPPVFITVSNVGPVAVNFSGFSIGGTNSSDFAIQSNTCPSQLAVGNNCTLGITFTPTALGARSATLSIGDDGGGSPQQLSLNGTGGTGIVSIAIAPTTPTIPAGATQQFDAVATYSDGSTKDITTSATWSSSNTGVATVGAATGLATAVADGASTILAMDGTITGSATLTVSQ